MTCPKCQGQMRQYERSGITIDQCTECRGIFLDRGELEKLIDAEASWSEAQHPTTAAPPTAAPGGYRPPPPPPAQPVYPAPAYGHYGYHGHYRHKRHRGFLGELFD